MKTICSCCQKEYTHKEFCCRDCAEKTLEDLLKDIRKAPDQRFISRLKEIIIKHQGKVSEKRVQEAFSSSEAIDKFVIIAVKNKYLTGERLKQNEKDYDAMESIMIREFQRHQVNDIEKMLELIANLWEVNAGIFCVNDICSEHEDDTIVAASARRMIVMIKERNHIKHEIASLLHEVMYETKQFKAK